MSLETGERGTVATSIQTPREFDRKDKIFEKMLLSVSFIPVLLLASIFIYLLYLSSPSLRENGFSFFIGKDWNPAKLKFGALPFIEGTLVTSFVALLIAAPLSIGSALFIVEFAPKKLGNFIRFIIELLSSIPSVIFGLWGLTIVAPVLRVTVQPFLAKTFSFTSLFSGMPYGVGVFSSSLILAIMILPTITSLSIEIFKSIPSQNRESALAIGATSMEMIFISVLGASINGLFAAVLLGWARALGETMAVTMLIGNRSEMIQSLFSPAQTIASLIANEYAEASHPLHLGALAELGLTLFFLSFSVNFISKKIIKRAIQS